MKENLKQKLTSKVTWVTIIPLVASLITLWHPGVSEQFTQVATTIVTVLAVFGILNNPNDRENF